MNEFDKTNQQHVNKGSGRRKFLKKSATGAVVFSLPAKSVWGACTPSGAMSGNLSNHKPDTHTCTVPALGVAPNDGVWNGSTKDLLKLFSVVVTAKDDKDAGDITKEQYDEIKLKYTEECDAAMANSLELPDSIILVSPTAQEALDDGGYWAWLGAIYLNARLGFYQTDYPQYSGAAGAKALVNEVFLFLMQNENSDPPQPYSGSDFGLVGSGFELSDLVLP